MKKNAECHYQVHATHRSDNSEDVCVVRTRLILCEHPSRRGRLEQKRALNEKAKMKRQREEQRVRASEIAGIPMAARSSCASN
jgi:hypothetical protein